MSFSFLIETKICSQKPKSKAQKDFQALVSPQMTDDTCGGRVRREPLKLNSPLTRLACFDQMQFSS
ncbi:hypothetical protein [Nostoc sp. UHCC 0302]|uniref:hypothetical protein n=1 Tax=Nostoc sp. UHCC 0302 TaxID=3134896 RepID=UPI00311CA739